MKILMDADCLIKLTKAGLKENICTQYEVSIPGIVKREVVDEGKIRGYQDAGLIEKNIEGGFIEVLSAHSHHIKGDQALLEAFKRGLHSFVVTDDTKLTKILKATAIPFVLPAILIYLLSKKESIDQATALEWLDRLSAFISNDEYAAARLLMERNI